MKRPNLALLVMDSVRADHLPLWGYARTHTPIFDSLAREGTLFKQAIATAPASVPSHASLFTGLFPSEHGLIEAGSTLRPDALWLPEFLAANGYRTGGFTSNQFLTALPEFRRGFQTFVDTHRAGLPKTRARRLMRRVKRGLVGGDSGGAATTRAIDAWLGVDDRRPFFLFANYMEPHTPYLPPSQFLVETPRRGVSREGVSPRNVFPANRDDPSGRLYTGVFAAPSILSDRLRAYRTFYRKPLANFRAYFGQFHPAPRDLESLARLYDGEINHMDFLLGELVEVLRRRGVLDNTLLFICADHGELFGEHGLLQHGFGLYEGIIHVPLLVRAPGLFDVGQTVETQVQLTDLFPTLLNVASLAPDYTARLRSKDLREKIAHPELGRWALSERRVSPASLERIKTRLPGFNFGAFDFKQLDVDLRAVRAWPHKLIDAGGGDRELYDLAADPSETDNRYNADVAATLRLTGLLDETVRALDTYEPGYRAPDFDERVTKRLEDLGYI